MKRYLLFKGAEFYPSGGWDDFEGDYETIQEAKDNTQDCDWWQIVDTQTGSVIRKFSNECEVCLELPGVCVCNK